MFGRFLPYLASGFWLVLPPLIIDGLFTSSLPAAFQPDSFWRDIPEIIALPENVLRFFVIGLTIVLPLPWPLGRLGGKRLDLAVYATGLIAYALSWAMLIAWPSGGWSTSAIGFSAPAWTPLLWLFGIGLVADASRLRRFGFILPIYWTAAIAFCVFHSIHALTVFARL